MSSIEQDVKAAYRLAYVFAPWAKVVYRGLSGAWYAALDAIWNGKAWASSNAVPISFISDEVRTSSRNFIDVLDFESKV